MTEQAKAFLTARWRRLAMLSYEIDPAVLSPRVPAGTELDSWEGRTFVSVVGFRFLDTRVLGVAVPFHRDFDEVNLRFYVRRTAPDGVRRGVVFVKEIVPRRAIAYLARRCYNENYVALPMRHREAMTGSDRRSLSYEWRAAGRWHGLRLAVEGRPSLAPASSEEAFISEHYWGYVRQRDGSTVEYRVDHPRWSVWSATGAALDCDVEYLYGKPFVAALAGTPTSAFLADGSEVVVRRGRPLSTA